MYNYLSSQRGCLCIRTSINPSVTHLKTILNKNFEINNSTSLKKQFFFVPVLIITHCFPNVSRKPVACSLPLTNDAYPGIRI